VRRRQSHIFEKERRGHYVEPAWCSRRLFEVEKFTGPIYDPACGWATILGEACAAGHTVLGSDIVDRGNRFGLSCLKRDFLTWHGRIRGDVVSNPPFDHVREFCEHALNLEASKVAIICLVRRLNAARWLQDLPLRRIWLLTPRPSMPPGSWIAKGNKPGGGTQDFCWLVFERGYAGEPSIGWLHRDLGETSDGRGTLSRASGGTSQSSTRLDSVVESEPG
jgi:hypothetical protein